jgi:hypothetical protein
MKDFKPSTYKIDRVNGLYKYTDENASWTQAEIRKYLEANLSEKAKSQLKIHGDVRYNNDPRQLGQVYKNIAQNEMQQYDAGISFINKKLTTTTKKEEADALKSYKAKLEDKKKALALDIENIDKGDFTMVKKKGEQLAYNIYFNEVMNKVSNGWSHKDITHKINGDDVSLAIYKENRADARQEASFRHTERMATLKGEIAPPPQTRRLLSGEEEQFTRESTGRKINDFEKQNETLSAANKGMVATWKSSLPENKGKTFRVEDITQNDIADYKKRGMAGKELPNDHPLRANETTMRSNERKIEIYNGKLRDIENKVIEGYSPEKRAEIENIKKQREALIKQTGTITFNDGVSISAEKLAEGIKNGTIKVSNNRGKEILGNINFANAVGGEFKSLDITMDGKTRTVSYRVGENTNNSRVHNVISQINQLNEKGAYGELKSDVDTYIKNNYKEVGLHSNIMTFSDGSYEAKTLTSEIRNLFPEAQYNVQHAGIGMDETNQGSAYFYISGKSGTGVTDDKIEGYLREQGYTNVSIIKTQGGPSLVRIGDFKSQVISQYSQYNNEEIEIIHQLVTESSARDQGKFMTSPYNSNSPRNLAIMRDHGQYWLMVQGIDGGTDLDMLPYPFSTPEGAVIKGQQLTATIGGVPEALLQNYIKLANQ